eukprot:1990515-Lingulodinium_polyedra.AAC.1
MARAEVLDLLAKPPGLRGGPAPQGARRHRGPQREFHRLRGPLDDPPAPNVGARVRLHREVP